MSVTDLKNGSAFYLRSCSKLAIVSLNTLFVLTCTCSRLHAEQSEVPSPPIAIDLVAPKEINTPLYVKIKSHLDGAKLLANKNLDVSFNMIVHYSRLNEGKYSRLSPIIGRMQIPLTKNTNEQYQIISNQPINLHSKFIDFIRANKNLFEAQDSISGIEIRVVIRGLIINGHWDNTNFSREQIYSAKFFSKWISVDPKYVDSALSRNP